ncbi:pollen receptor-like kinase 1 [Salvia miltiorrhiza]|uniref:pollen receptor-like kinase 1 n=1 Tax=Salvia miltiorrhiza TaxID=226208 RepID=UPI0025AC758A|nr:pollen receptor-like kinase 1 [Salvia miltiorrhiza]
MAKRRKRRAHISGGSRGGRKQKRGWALISSTQISHFFLLPFYPTVTVAGRTSCRGPRASPKCAHHNHRRSYAITMARASPSTSHAFLLIAFLLLLHLASAQPEADALLKFKASITNNALALSNWTAPAPPCTDSAANWNGLLCENGTVGGLQLQSMGLEGTIDVDALAQLPNLKVLSFAGNSFAGPLPNLAALPNVRVVSLSNNKMSGAIPANAFLGMVALAQLDLDNNEFSGEIPASLAGLPALQELMLQNNRFEGGLPQFRQGQLKNFSVANNALSGEIPPGLSHLEVSAFLGNKDLCGTPLLLCANHPLRLSIGTIIMMSLVVAAALAALVAVILILCRRRAPPQDGAEAAAPAVLSAVVVESGAALDRMESGQQRSAPSSPAAGGAHQRRKSEGNVRITFLKEDCDVFDMTDLLKASAEILGSGVFGSTYKAALTERQIVVVKRYRHMGNVSKQDFSEHMRRLGRLSHPNVVPLVAFYYRREEKLLVYDYINKTSLAALLHGNRSRPGRRIPDWPTRLSISKGVARGLLYLHTELPSLTAAHGHLKSSNVILHPDNTPSLTDYGLVPIVNQEHAEQHMISYKSPEYKHTRRITKKTDVWSLGILILEILTARFPADFLKPRKDAPDADAAAAAWVESLAADEAAGVDVFDADMARDADCQGETMKLLRIGFACCRAEVEERPDIKEAAQQIEEVRERDTV